MQIQTIDNTNFQGGYKLIKVSKAAKAELETLTPEQVLFDSFEGKKSNVFLIAKNRYHNIVAEFIRNHNIAYKYYPKIRKPRNLREDTAEFISSLLSKHTPEEINYANVAKSIEHRARQHFARDYGDEYVSNILKTLNLSMDEETQKIKYGARTFQNQNHTKSIAVSAPSKERVLYVKITPLVSTTGQEPARRLAMSPDGEILRDFTHKFEDWVLFNHRFNATLDR